MRRAAKIMEEHLSTTAVSDINENITKQWRTAATLFSEGSGQIKSGQVFLASSWFAQGHVVSTTAVSVVEVLITVTGT